MCYMAQLGPFTSLASLPRAETLIAVCCSRSYLENQMAWRWAGASQRSSSSARTTSPPVPAMTSCRCLPCTNRLAVCALTPSHW